MACCYKEVRNYEKILFIKAGFFKLSVKGSLGQFLDSLVYPQKYIMSWITIFSLHKRRTGSFKVIASADVQFSIPNQVKSKKDHRVRRSPVFPKNQVKTKK